MPNPSPRRQDNRTYPTPRIEDILFREIVEVSRQCPPGVNLPYAYGTTYPSIFPAPAGTTQRYSNHKFVLSENIDEEGLWQAWWFCADRDDQESYAYALEYPYANAPEYFRITRTYILPRGEDPLDLGSPDPGNPFGDGPYTYLQPTPSTDTYLQPSPSTDGYNQPSTSPTSSGAVLVAQSEQPLEYDSKISSLYVRVTRVYQKIPGAEDTVPGSGAGQTDDSYVVERPLGTASFFRLTWTLNLPRAIADTYKSTDYKQCIIPGYESLRLIQETIKASDENNQVSEVVRIYEGNIIASAFPSADHIFYQGNFQPSNMPPDKFIVSKRKAVITRITASPQSQVVLTPLTPSETSGLSRLESIEAKPSNDSPVLTGTKEETYYTDIVLRYISGEQWDDNIRDVVPYTVFVITLDDYEDGILGDPDAGTQRDVTPLGTGWVMVTIQTPRETSLTDFGIVNPFTLTFAATARNYFTYQVKHWPNVLAELILNESPTGESAIDYEFRPREWNGPCKCCIQVAWQVAPPNLMLPIYAVQFMDPTSLRIQWPGQLSVSIPECLHYNPDPDVVTEGYPPGAYIFTSTIYPFKVWLPTNFRTWPDQYVEQIRVVPYLGGWWITKIWVQKPSVGNVSS